MEVTGQHPEFSIPLPISKELGAETAQQLTMFIETLDEYAKKSGIDVDLVLVGGIVNPKKQGQQHKDVDLLFYSPQLATETYLGGPHPLFDRLAEFVSLVAEEGLGWNKKVLNPFFFDYQTATDGEIYVYPPKGLPLEILPVRKSDIADSVATYLKRNTRPHHVLYRSVTYR